MSYVLPTGLDLISDACPELCLVSFVALAHWCYAISPHCCRLLGVPKAFKKMLRDNPQIGAKSVIPSLGNALRDVSPWSKHKLVPAKTVSVAAALGTYATPAIGGALVVAGVLGATVGDRFLGLLG